MARTLISSFPNVLRRNLSRFCAALPVLAAFAMSAAPAAQAQALTQVPFGSIYLGVPSSTFNGTDGQACTSTNPSYLDFYGDGCPATQAVLNLPAGIAMDTYNNLYVADYNDKLIRVVYQGGAATAALLVAANPKFTFTPVVGSVYPVGGGGASLTSVSGVYYCGNTGTGPTALDKAGDGCPASYSYDQARSVAVDREGNIFIAGVQPFNSVRIVYAGGPIGAKLITTYNPSVVTPQIGYIYALSANGDFSSIRQVAVDDNDNIYAADTGTQVAAGTGLQATTVGNQIKKFSGTGWTTYILGSSTLATGTGNNGDGGSSSTVVLTNPLGLATDHSGNVYFAEGSGRIRVVYNGGTTPPLYIQGANSVVVTSPVVGNVYSVAGGGTARTSGSLASALNIAVGGANLSSFAIDNSGNLLFTDSQAASYGFTWREDARTGIATIIGGDGTKTASFSAATTPAAGQPCNGATGGPLMTDAFASGCPATEILPYTPRSPMVFDSFGNFYQSEVRTSSSNGIIRKYTFANQFGAVPTGTTATTTLAFTPTTAASLTPTQSYVLTGDSTNEFTDGGGSLCSISGSIATQTCTYNVNFKPALAGQRLGAITLTATGVTPTSVPIGGIGTAAQITLDPGTQTTVGTGLAPSGTGVDQGGVAYVADGTTGNLYKSTNGGALTQVATGLKNPGQVAVDGSGNVFVADTGNNRIAIAVNVAVPTAEVNALAAQTFSGPTGVAADLSGNLYIADTGNSRVVMITPLGGVSTKAFTGLASPRGLAVDAAGDIFVADTGNARIVELPAATPGNQPAQVVPAITPALVTPVSVALDPAGNLYVADSAVQNIVVVPAGGTTASTLLGGLATLNGIAVDATGDVFVAAASKPGLVELNRTATTYAFPETNVGQTSTQVITITNSGNAALVLGATLGTGTDTTDFSTGTTTSGSCTANQTLAVGQSCSVLATFKPQSKTTLQSTVTFASNAADAATLLLTGTGVQKISTTTAVTYTTTTGGQPIAGQAFTVTAKITPATSGAAIGGSVSFSVDGGTAVVVQVASGAASTTFTLAAGSHSIVAKFSGDANYTASTGTLTVVAVSPSQTTTALTFNPAQPGNATVFTATATITPVATQGAIGGTVTFTVNGYTPVQTATVTVTNGVASTNFTLPTGRYTVTANYSGSAYYLASTVTTPVQVIPTGTSSVKLTLTSPPTGAITFGQTVVVGAALTTGNATATPTGTVTFTVDGGSPQTFNYATSLSATFTGLTAGAHVIAATYGGDNAYAPSTGTLNITVARATPTAVLRVTPNVAATGNSFIVTANVTSAIAPPTGTVTLTVAGVTYGPTSLINGVATFLIGTNVLSSYAFSATYNGDGNFAPVTFTSTPTPDFVAVVQSLSVSTPQYGIALDYVSVNSFYNYTGTVQLTCAGLPANTVCRGTPSSAVITSNGATSVQLQIITDVDPLATASLDGSRPLQHSSRGTEASIAFALLLALPLLRSRRRFGKGLAVLVMACATIAGMSGCGSDTRQTTAYITPLGTYPITVTVSDGTISHTVNMSLTVLPGTSANRP